MATSPHVQLTTADKDAFLEAIHMLSSPVKRSPVKNDNPNFGHSTSSLKQTSSSINPTIKPKFAKNFARSASPIPAYVDSPSEFYQTDEVSNSQRKRKHEKSGEKSRKVKIAAEKTQDGSTKQKSPKKKAMEFLLEQEARKERKMDTRFEKMPSISRIEVPSAQVPYIECSTPLPMERCSDTNLNTNANLAIPGEDACKKKKRTKYQKEKDALAAMLRPQSPKSMGGLCSQFVKDLNAALFMHESKSVDLKELLKGQTDADSTDMYESVARLLLCEPHPKPLLVRLLGLFLSSEDCQRLGVDKFVKTYRAAAVVLVKLERYLSSSRSRSNCRHILRSMKRLGALQDPVPLMNFCRMEFACDQELLAELQVLFPNIPCDHRDVICADQFETISILGEDVDSQCKQDHFEAMKIPQEGYPCTSIANVNSTQCVCTCHQEQKEHCQICRIKICRDGRIFVFDDTAQKYTVAQRLEYEAEMTSGDEFGDEIVDQFGDQTFGQRFGDRQVSQESCVGSGVLQNVISEELIKDNAQIQEMMRAVSEMEGQTDISAQRKPHSDMLRDVVYDVFGNSRFDFDASSTVVGSNRQGSQAPSTVFLKGSHAKGLMLHERAEGKSMKVEAPWTQQEDSTLLEILFERCHGNLSEAVNCAAETVKQRTGLEISKRYEILASLLKQNAA